MIFQFSKKGDVAVTLRELGLQSPTGYRVEDLYEDVDYGVLTSSTKIKVKVNPSGCVILKMETIPERFSKRPNQQNPFYYRYNQN